MSESLHSRLHHSRHWGIVLAAGDGTRIQHYVARLKGRAVPKQYVNFLGPRSLLEHTFERAEKLIAPARIFTVVGKHHLQYEEARQQLARRKKDTVIVQPANKETGPGILLPLMHLHKRAPEAIVSIYPSDHFILENDRFMDHVDLAVQAVTSDPSHLVLLATEPHEPEIEYGYVLPSNDSAQLNIYGTKQVLRFIEKPGAGIVSHLIERGGLWNTMVMVFAVKTVLDMFERIQPEVFNSFRRILDAIDTPHEEATIEEVYRNLQPVNFSKGFLERLPDSYPRAIHVMPVLQVLWSDWGSRERVLKARRLLKQSTQRRTSVGASLDHLHALPSSVDRLSVA